MSEELEFTHCLMCGAPNDWEDDESKAWNAALDHVWQQILYASKFDEDRRDDQMIYIEDLVKVFKEARKA